MRFARWMMHSLTLRVLALPLNALGKIARSQSSTKRKFFVTSRVHLSNWRFLVMAFCELHFWSKSLGRQTACNLIIPQGQDAPWATFYLLHGASDDHTIWARRTSIERYVEGLPLLVMMPEGGGSGFW